MFTLTGILRQFSVANVKKDDKSIEKLKVWIEHKSERDNGAFDLKIEELWLPLSEQPKLPPDGSEITLSVRPYASKDRLGIVATSILERNKGSIDKKAAT
jgi:hypothetical protein